MSELAQELIKSRTQSNSWSLQSYPGKVKLPSDILRALPSSDAANKVNSQSVIFFETFTDTHGPDIKDYLSTSGNFIMAC
jgi:sister-chromatid-cohesion protein PDS5